MTVVRPNTRDAIIEAAFQLFAEKPTSSLGEVADRAGVGRATLHRYFPGRSELMSALAKIAMEDLDRAVKDATADSESYEEGFRLSLHAIVPLANRQWFLAQEGVEADEEVAAAYQASHQELLQDLEMAKAEGFIDAAMPTSWIAEVYRNLIYAAWSIVRSGEATPKQAADLAWRTFCAGLKGKAQ